MPLEGIHSEVALVDGDDHCILLQELCEDPRDPEPALVVGWVYVLDHRRVHRLVLEVEVLLQDRVYRM